MDVGSASDNIDLLNSEKIGVTSTILVNINGLSGLTGSTQTLLTSANTGTFSIGAGANFLLNTTTGNFSGYTLHYPRPLPGNFN